MEYLQTNRKYFQKAIKTAQLLYEEKLYEDCAQYIQKIGLFAWLHHTGYYACKELELILEKLGDLLPSFDAYKTKDKANSKGLNILHIFSEIYTLGGHSKLMFKWIDIDHLNNHSILSTKQEVEEIKEVYNFFNLGYVSEFLSVKTASILESSILLKEALYNNYDLVVLHIHPNEVVCNIAFADREINTPIAFLNHADHVFWFGGAIVDVVIQIREVNIQLDTYRRKLKKQFFLPIPISIKEGIANQTKKGDFLHLASVGSSYKYTPKDGYNLFEQAIYIVNKYNNVIFNFVGVSNSSELAKKYSHDRIVYHGVLLPNELEHFVDSVDIYIEGFPMPSFTALLEFSMKGIPFLLHYNPSNLLKLFNDNLDDAINYPKDLATWRDQLDELINKVSVRQSVARKQFNYVESTFGEDAWADRLKSFYEVILKMEKSHFLCNDEDYLLESRDEKELLNVHNESINHFSFTNKLTLKNKLYVIYSLKDRTDNVSINGFKTVYKWLFHKEIVN